ncbi:hypothetical protein G9F32_06780 [Acinetobacter sp. 194]|uniref:hypothetical protein n=1 Tax=Acinetobacter shaoyimingii TaxID=2715164 RepID=UPI00140C8CF7|nr:hypothetical protein [Acinetobacter shaoyimingii]NHB57738.1 hypothetical protein [Acinetobacter shaoyimingii]
MPIPIIDTQYFHLLQIPNKYQHQSFVQFALSFDPRTDTMANNFQQIPLNRFPTQDDSIIAIRVYLYSIQRIMNQHTNEDTYFIEAINQSYKILKEKKIESVLPLSI